MSIDWLTPSLIFPSNIPPGAEKPVLLTFSKMSTKQLNPLSLTLPFRKVDNVTEPKHLHVSSRKIILAHTSNKNFLINSMRLVY